MTVNPGLEVLHDDQFRALAGQRVGLMTNPSAVDARLQSAYNIFAQSPHVNLTALFGPEHGFAGAAPDAAPVSSTTDPRTGLPVFSLYGATYRPTPEILDHVDVLVCDIQDIGVRYYTYPWTVSHILEAAGAHGVRVMILDRPNPLGGTIIDGPLLDMSMSSFVGRFPIPVRHGLTLGELAQMINTTWNPTPADLSVIPCVGWTRDQVWRDTGLPWVPPSPNIPQLTTLAHYPGACLIEGTQLSEGRGTTLPFEIVGAPWIDGMALAEQLNADGWTEPMGARFRPHTFIPTSSKRHGQSCNGVQVHITAPARWRPIEVWLGVLITIAALYPDQFEWLPTHPDTHSQHFDRLIGGRWVRRRIAADIQAGKETRAILAQLASEWGEDRHAFALQRRPHLLYD
ncbi:MAG: DUF1343 domain-containing protein [Anaerolineae bacterium]|nr:DUF1343 domain-containing protein [Anaerolineae bacterium]